METNLNALKQPEPKVTNGTNTPKREYARPNVGVVDVPQISKTPLTDVVELKRQENPHTIYKLSDKPKSDFKFQGICSFGILLGSVASLIALFAKKK